MGPCPHATGGFASLLLCFVELTDKPVIARYRSKRWEMSPQVRSVVVVWSLPRSWSDPGSSAAIEMGRTLEACTLPVAVVGGTIY